VSAGSFLGAQVATDGFDVIVELASILLSNGANFLDHGILVHG
jgi:hypothetical protein